MTQSGLIGFGANSTSAGAAKETAGADIIGSSDCLARLSILNQRIVIASGAKQSGGWIASPWSVLATTM
jgi:hypothetical protein